MLGGVLVSLLSYLPAQTLRIYDILHRHISCTCLFFLSNLLFYVKTLPTNCLSVLDHFVGLALKGLTEASYEITVVRRSVR